MLSPRPDSLQYGGETFRAASSFLRRVVPGVPSDDAQERRASMLVGAGATALLLSRLPALTVCLSDTPAGERLRRHFGDRKWGLLHSRLAQGVLVLPEAPGRYLRGRSRQALRTNIHKARDAGISCQRLHYLGQTRAATLQLRERAGDRVHWPDEQFRLPGDVWWSARDRRGEAVALAQVTVDREWALLQLLVSSHHPSRCLLHSEVIEALVAAQVRYLIVNTSMAPLLEPSLQYWQRLLGFRVANLAVRAEPLSPQRLVPSDAVESEAYPPLGPASEPEAAPPVAALLAP